MTDVIGQSEKRLKTMQVAEYLCKDTCMHTIEQEIEALAKKRWPKAGRIDIGSKMSHQWHGDIEPPITGFSVLVSTKKGELITRIQAETLEDLKAKVGASCVD